MGDSFLSFGVRRSTLDVRRLAFGVFRRCVRAVLGSFYGGGGGKARSLFGFCLGMFAG